MRIKHQSLCEFNDIAKMVMPIKNKKIREKNPDETITTKIVDQTKLKFKKYSAYLKPPAVIYGDFEAINKEIKLKPQLIQFLTKNKEYIKPYNKFPYVYNENESKNSNYKIRMFFHSINKSTLKLFQQLPFSYCLFIKSNYPEII